MSDSVYRYSLSNLPPRADNWNPFRRKWDVLTAQRQEMIESLRFLISININNDSDEAHTKLDQLFTMYKKTMFPEDITKVRKEEQNLFAPWKDFFGKQVSIKLQDDKGKLKKIERTFKVKNLSKM